MLAGQSSKLLLLSSTEGKHTGRSGYSVIGDYMPGAAIIEVLRKSPHGFSERLPDAILSRIALSKWYKKSSFKLEWKALEHIKKNRTKVVHLLWGDRDIGFLDMFSKKKDFKICCTIHNCASMLDGLFNFPGRLKKIDAFILVSETQKPFLLKAGVPEEKIHVVLHGIDNQYFKPAAQKAQTGRFNVLSVGSWQRDFELLREICIRLEPAGIHINIISPDKFKYYFDDLKHVSFRSGLSNAELLQAYQEADCFLMTIKDASANNAILEAMACGLPVVAERIGGIPEYVNEHCASLCTPKNAEEISMQVLRIARSKELQDKMGAESRSRALQLDWSKMAAQVEKIYSLLLS